MLRAAQKPILSIINYAICWLLCSAKHGFVHARSAASSTYDPDEPALGLGPFMPAKAANEYIHNVLVLREGIRYEDVGMVGSAGQSSEWRGGSD